MDRHLQAHGKKIASERMIDWFAQDLTRQQRLSVQACGLTLDYSHNLVTDETLALLAKRCETAQTRHQIEAMMAGEAVNATEQRAALHTALRDPLPTPLMVNGHNIKQDIKAARLECQSLVQEISQRGITDIVHVGLGGSYWGPLCVYQALAHLPSHYRIHFVATLDPAELTSTLSHLNPEKTLFILASKSFTTHEMLANAEIAKSWLKQAHVNLYEKHFIAITENKPAALSWGIPDAQIMPVWEWIGGRFSVWSLMGLPIILAYGFDVFDRFLSGAHLMDQHVTSAPWHQNMPALLAMIEYWYRNFFHLNNLAVIPYEYALRSLIPHLQQLHMESLGKPGNGPTGCIVWGALGSHAQHTFNQLLHQGTEIVPIDFILSRTACIKTPALEHHCFAQRQALMTGHDADNTHAKLEGNRPSNLILLDDLSPENIGSLLALYEHKIAVLALLYGVNAFDQFGVEYSKKLARERMR